MSAVILPFKGEWQGGDKPEHKPEQSRAERRAICDARLIRDAKSENDDWTARLLLAMLETLDRTQLARLEFRLIGPEGSQMNSQSACQALAIVQLASGDKSHRQRVCSLLKRLDASEVE